jgi:hypothetical protein
MNLKRKKGREEENKRESKRKNKLCVTSVALDVKV